MNIKLYNCLRAETVTSAKSRPKPHQDKYECFTISLSVFEKNYLSFL